VGAGSQPRVDGSQGRRVTASGVAQPGSQQRLAGGGQGCSATGSAPALGISTTRGLACAVCQPPHMRRAAAAEQLAAISPDRSRWWDAGMQAHQSLLCDAGDQGTGLGEESTNRQPAARHQSWRLAFKAQPLVGLQVGMKPHCVIQRRHHGHERVGAAKRQHGSAQQAQIRRVSGCSCLKDAPPAWRRIMRWWNRLGSQPEHVVRGRGGEGQRIVKAAVTHIHGGGIVQLALQTGTEHVRQPRISQDGQQPCRRVRQRCRRRQSLWHAVRVIPW